MPRGTAWSSIGSNKPGISKKIEWAFQFPVQVFSPIRDHAEFFLSPHATDFVAAGRRSTLSSSRLSHESVFSPLRENSINGSFRGFEILLFEAS